MVQGTSDLYDSWFKTFKGLGLNEDEVKEYAQLFSDNDVLLEQIPSFSHDLLISMGIKKAGHRLKLLQLNTTTTSEKTPLLTGPQQIQVVMNENVGSTTKMCKYHKQSIAVERCRDCRFVYL